MHHMMDFSAFKLAEIPVFMKRLLSLIGLLACAGLAACGGGGGGGGSFLPIAASMPAASTAAAPVTLSGMVTFDSVPNPSGALVYSAVTRKPVRGALVELLAAQGGNVIGSTRTDAAGKYTVAGVPASTSVQLRVKAQLQQTGAGPTWDASVRDNTRGDALYALDTGAFDSGVVDLTRDVAAPSGWGGSSYTQLRAAAPFAILDTVYTAQQKVLSAAPNATFPPLRVFWSSNNLPASGDRTAGQIGTTFFTTDTTGGAIYVLGKENVDTDEYDESVVAHEWGHYYQWAFSRNDSPGGGHRMTDLLDRRVAFAEGWGNAWSGMALARSNYTDSVGAQQGQGANVDLTTGPPTLPGWFREASVQAVLWNLERQAGFKPIHDALSGPFKTDPALTDMHPFVAAFSQVAPGAAGQLATLLGTQAISAAANDSFGALETNDGGVALALPMYRPITLGNATNACVSNQAGAGNKLGNYSYLHFVSLAARNYQIVINGPAGTDPDLEVFASGRVGRSAAGGTSESLSIALPAGEVVLAINDYNNAAASTCFSVTIN